MTAVARPAPPPSRRSGLRDRSDRHRSLTIVLAMAVTTVAMYVLPLFPPFSAIQTAGTWYDAFANAGVFVLLAMGLNVVIGMAGLLDLGYAAFFAIGAYSYAFFASNPYVWCQNRSSIVSRGEVPLGVLSMSSLPPSQRMSSISATFTAAAASFL